MMVEAHDYCWVDGDTLAAGAVPRSPQDLLNFREVGIKHIVTLTEQALTEYQISGQLTAASFIYHHFPIPDGQPPTLLQAMQIIRIIQASDVNGGGVFMHCREGVGRTGTMLHFYFMVQFGTLDQAIPIVRYRRPKSAWENITEPQRQWLTKVATL